MAELGLSKLKWYYQLVVVCLIAGGVIYAVHTFVFDGMSVENDAKQSELDQVRARVSRGNAIAAQLPKFQADLIKLEQHLASLRQVLPEQRDVGDMLRRIQTLAAA